MQKKNYYHQKSFYKKRLEKSGIKSNSKVNKFKFNKNLSFFWKVIKYKFYGRKYFNKISPETIFSHKLNIIVMPNNVFCSFIETNTKKMLQSCSSGKYKIKTSKKKLKHTFNLVLTNFMVDLAKEIKPVGVILNISAPIKIRKKIIKFISLKFKKIPLLIQMLSKKSFNGCRPPKKLEKNDVV